MVCGGGGEKSRMCFGSVLILQGPLRNIPFIHVVQGLCVPESGCLYNIIYIYIYRPD